MIGDSRSDAGEKGLRRSTVLVILKSYPHSLLLNKPAKLSVVEMCCDEPFISDVQYNRVRLMLEVCLTNHRSATLPTEWNTRDYMGTYSMFC